MIDILIVKHKFQHFNLHRYSQLLALRATSKQQHLNQNQMQLLRAQISAYRSLARNQPLSKQIQEVLTGPPGFDNSNSSAANTRRTPPQCPTPPASPYQQPPNGPVENQQPSSIPPHQQPPGENLSILTTYIIIL